MRVRRVTRSKLRLWMLLLSAFTIVGAAAGCAILNLTIDRYRTDVRRELLHTAQLLSLHVDPQAHAGLTHRSQSDSPSYTAMIARLANAQRHLPDIRYIYTLTRVAPGDYRFVLDPTAPGDHDGDGIDDRSYLMDPYPEINSIAKSVMDTGVAQSEPAFTKDRWGCFWSAYAPIVADDGHVVGIIGVDIKADDVAGRIGELYRAAGIAFIAVLFAGIVFATALTRQLASHVPRSSKLWTMFGNPRSVRTLILELIFCSLACLVFFLASNSYLSYQKQRTVRLGSVRQTDNLTQLQYRINRVLTAERPLPNQLAELERDAQRLNIPWALATLQDSSKILPAEGWQKALLRLNGQVGLEIQRERLARQETQALLDDGLNGLISAFLLTLVLFLGALVLIRFAGKQQHALLRAQNDSEKHLTAYERVAEHLPIGLFTITDGVLDYTNATWDRLFRRGEADERADAFLASLHPDDREHVESTFATCDFEPETLELTFRIVGKLGAVRYMSSRILPVLDQDGALDYMLGFVIDVTDQMQAKHSLEARTEELGLTNNELKNAVTQLEENFEAMVQSLVKAVEAKDPYTAGHSERVMGYSVSIGERVGLSAHEMRVLQMATLIHDVGKIGIPDEILTKPGRLSDEEFAIVKGHPLLGVQMVENIPLFKDCIPIIRWHHERMNGTGYPDGLPAGDLPLSVRIAAVADVFDAITSTRAYRSALEVEEALEELRKDARAGGLDPEIVEVLAEIVKRDGVLWCSYTDPKAA